jgi:ATP-dependent Zn protease
VTTGGNHSAELKRTAYHEAGHAFVAWRERLPVKRATIKPHDGLLGAVRHGSGFMAKQLADIDRAEITPAIRGKLEKHIRVLLAGWLAERHYDRAANEESAHTDFRNAIDYMMVMTSSQREMDLYFALLRYQTTTMLRIGWPHVKALAAALLESETLRGKDVAAIIYKSMRGAAGDEKSQSPI